MKAYKSRLVLIKMIKGDRMIIRKAFKHIMSNDNNMNPGNLNWLPDESFFKLNIIYLVNGR